MKTAKEAARELGIDYRQLIYYLRVRSWPKMFGIYRFNNYDVEVLRKEIDEIQSRSHRG